MSDETTGPTPVNEVSEDTPTSDVANPVTARGQRRKAWFAVAAGVAAGVVLVGGSAYAFGTSHAKTTGVKAAFTLGNAVPAANTLGTAAGMSSRDAKVSSGMMPFYGGSRTIFTAAAGLSDASGSATAWAFDASGVNQEALANALAKSFGIADAATQTNGQWVAGSQDGTSANVTVGLDGQTSVYYYDPQNDPFNCIYPPGVATPEAKPSAGTAGSGAGPSAGSAPGSVGNAPAPGPSCSPKNAAPLGTTSDAIAASKDIVKTLGLDPANFQWDATSPSDQGQPVIYVSASQVVNGQLTGLAEQFTFGGGNKLSNFYGFAAPLVSLGSYGVISEKDAVARLMDPAFGSSFGPIAYDTMRGGVAPMMKDAAVSSNSSGTVTASSAPVPAPTVPATPTAGGQFSWPVAQVTIVKAELGVAQYYEPNGAVVLLPTYQLTGSDKSTWTVIAVDKSALDTTVPAN